MENCQILPPVFDFSSGKYGVGERDLSTIGDGGGRDHFSQGVHTDSAIHSVGEIIWHTGHQLAGFPSMGSWVTYGLGCERADLPAYLVMKDGVSTAGDEVFQQGMLPGRHQAAVAREAGKTPFPNLNPRPGSASSAALS